MGVKIAAAQEDTIRTIEMTNITISENRFDIPFAEASRNISIINSDDIKRTSARSIPEVLSFIPGVDIRQRGPLGAQADISIRGGSFEQTLVLINGIKMSDPQTGHHALSLPINIHNIERVEVLKGPGARIFGQNAFSGAVNFITKIPEDRALFFNAYGGDFGLYGASIGVSLPETSYKQYISVSQDISDGYRHNTDFDIKNLFYQSEFQVSNGQISILGGIVDRKFGANGYYANPSYSEQYEEVTTSLVSVGYSGTFDNVNLKPRIYWRRNQDDYVFFRNSPSSYRNNHFTSVWGIEINSSIEGDLGTTGIGLEMRTEQIMGDWERGGEAQKSNLDGFHREKVGLFAEHKFKLLNNHFHVTPGVFLNYYTDFGYNAFPGLDIGFSPVKFLRIYGNWGKSYRIPTFYDQHYSSPTEVGNPDLKPETAMSYEGGIRFMKKGIVFEGNYFYQKADEIIDWTMIDSVFYAQNLSDVHTRGVEFSLNLNFKEIAGPDFFIDHIYLSYNHINANIKLPETVTSRYVLDNLSDQMILGIGHKITRNLNHNMKIRRVDRVNQPAYWLWDIKVNYDWNDLSIFGEISNLTDTQYIEIMTPMPGRWFRIGANYALKF